MRKKPRHGTTSAPLSYETELIHGGLDDIYEAVLGGTTAAAFDITEADVTSVTISGSGVTITGGSGSFITEGVRAGMMGKFATLSEAANNDVWFPILNVTATVLTIPTGILIDNAADTAFTLTIARSVSTTDPYLKRYFTVEEYWADIDRSKLGTDVVWNQLAMSAGIDSPIRTSFGGMGRDMTLLATGDSPNFTDPVFTQGNSLVLLDGGLYLNGVRRGNVTSFEWGLAAPISAPGSVGSRTPVDVSLGQFALTGQLGTYIEDGTDFEAAVAETTMSAVLHCAERGANPANFVAVYLGNLSYGSFAVPAGGEGLAVATIPIYGGDDDRGTGFAQTSVLISTSAAA
jgi:hypothetical protein